ncbi:MAG: 50S ribosomal protein L20 [Lentisphaeria bacterium]|jgi:large subunit ribosomal protein L20|nr:50S ribosomal protein L20 [Lentisphaeria bacterium]MBR7140464.1 50S ribosomal protein L20 [Lentisphaeria bacterium]
MSRVTCAVSSRKRRKRVLERAKGFYGNASRNIRTVYDAVNKAKSHSYVGRKQKKRQYRALWIVRINAACRMLNVSYSRFMAGLKNANITLNRKVLADLAVTNPAEFKALVEKVTQA